LETVGNFFSDKFQVKLQWFSIFSIFSNLMGIIKLCNFDPSKSWSILIRSKF